MTGKWVMIAAALAIGLDVPATSQSGETVIYSGARVWTGAGFERRDLAVRNGRLVPSARAGKSARRIALNGKYVVPAYANAHAHITNPDAQTSRAFTDAGVFYVWNPNTITVPRSARAFYARTDSYDVKLAMGGITEPGGHPERLYVDYLSTSVYDGKPKSWFVGNAFHYGSTPVEIEAALMAIKGQGADFVKVYLLNSERYAEIRNDPKFYGGRGLNPLHVAGLVRSAHRLGLPVVAHVETAHDLEVAARARVDMAAHLPGYSGSTPAEFASRRITPRIAQLVARAGMKVVPTYALIRGDSYGTDSALSPMSAPGLAVQRENMRLLRAAGVSLLIGTDGRDQIWTEVEHLAGPVGVPPLAVLRALLATGRALFPERRVGCFDNGCEADFLVLSADPSVDIRALRSIERRIMQGAELAAAS